MPPQAFKFFEPRELYKLAPGWWDFFLMWLLLTLLFKKSSNAVRYAREHGLKGLGRELGSALRGTDEHKALDNSISAVFALVITATATVYGNVTLKYLFESGLFPGFLGLLVGVMCYNAITARFGEENRLIAIAISFAISMGVFTILHFKGMAGTQWFTPLIPMIIIFAVWGALSKAKPTGDIGSFLGAAQGDIGSALSQLTGFEKKFAAMQNLGKEAETKQGGLMGTYQKTLDSLSASIERIEKTSVFRGLVASAFALALSLFARNAPASEIRKELKDKQYAAEVIDEAIAQLPATPAAAAAVEPEKAAEQLPIPEKEKEQLDKLITVNTALIDQAQKELGDQIQRFQNILHLLERVPGDLPQLFSTNKKIHDDLGKLQDHAIELVDKISGTPEAQPLLDKATGLQSSVRTLSVTVIDSNRTFQDGIQPLLSLLRSDADALNKLSAELQGKLGQIQEAFDRVKKQSQMLKREQRVAMADFQPYKIWLANIKRLIGETVPILQHHGGAEALLAALEGVVPILQNYPNVLTHIASEIEVLQKNWKLLDAGLKQATGKGDEEKHAASVRAGTSGVIELLDELIPQIKILETQKTAEAPDVRERIEAARKQIAALQGRLAELIENQYVAAKELYEVMLKEDGDLMTALKVFDERIERAMSETSIKGAMIAFRSGEWSTRLAEERDALKAKISAPKKESPPILFER